MFAARPRGKRWLAGGVMALLLVSMLAGLPLWGRLYNGQRLWLEPWSASSTATHSGLISSLMLFHLQYGHGQQKAEPGRRRTNCIGAAHDALLRSRLQAPHAGRRRCRTSWWCRASRSSTRASCKGYEHSQFTPNLERLAAARHQRPAARAHLRRRHHPHRVRGAHRAVAALLPGPAVSLPAAQAKAVPSLVRLLQRAWLRDDCHPRQRPVVLEPHQRLQGDRLRPLRVAVVVPGQRARTTASTWPTAP